MDPHREEGGKQGYQDMVPPQGNMDRMLFPGSGCSAVPAHHTEPATEQSPVKSIPTYFGGLGPCQQPFPTTKPFTCSAIKTWCRTGAHPLSQVSPCASHSSNGTGGKALFQGKWDGGVSRDQGNPSCTRGVVLPGAERSLSSWSWKEWEEKSPQWHCQD